MKKPIQKITIEDMQTLAAAQGGLCLSKVYLGTDTKLKWQCKNGHIWENRPAKIKKGQWCRACSKYAIKDLAYLHELAKRMSGECLAIEYKGMGVHAPWRCHLGHEWTAKPANVASGFWCPYCAGKRQTINDMRSLARARGGDCLSREYITQITKLKWRCREGHEWLAVPNSIKNGSWCPKCNINYGEEICRAYFEQIFGKPFPKSRPQFLREGRSSLELDGYCEDLGIAFEHHGRQHYKSVPMFHRAGQTLEGQRARDKRKTELSKKNGVTVIEIPEVPAVTTLEDLPRLIDLRLKEMGIKSSRKASSVKIDLSGIYNQSMLEGLQKIAKDKGGKLLSKAYMGDRIRLLWRCKNNHKWEAAPQNVKSGTWCAHCYGNVTKTIEDMLEIARERGIELLSTEYNGRHGKLTWKCTKGHIYQASAKSVTTSSLATNACIHCVGNVKTIDDMNDLAAKHGGRCLSKQYKNNQQYLQWECAKGHKFKATANIASKTKEIWCPTCRKETAGSKVQQDNIQILAEIFQERKGRHISGQLLNGDSILTVECSHGHQWKTSVLRLKTSWCAKCSNEQRGINSRLGIEEMQEIALRRGGKCLSKEYTSNLDKLLWQCSKDHEWMAAPHNIKRGKWCPYCVGKYKTATDMHSLAESRGFEFLSDKYMGDAVKHKWRCGKMHEWESAPTNIIQGRGCPTCGRERMTLADLADFGQEYDLSLNTKEYIGFKAKYSWSCKENHVWSSTIANLRKRRGCPICKQTSKLKR